MKMFLSSHCFIRTVLNSENGLKVFLSHCDNPKFTPFDYSTVRVYVNRKTRIKRAKNRMLLRITKVVRIKKLHVCARLCDVSLISMYEVVFLFFYYWRFIVLKNRLNSTEILHGYQWQANLLFAITVRTDLPNMLLPMQLRNRNI